MRDLFTMLAGYNAWANARLYDAAAALSDEDYRADHGAFFRSLHGTLNHLLVTDQIWMQRFTGQGEAPARLDAILYETLPELRAAREAEDARIVAWIGSLDDVALAGRLRYRRVSSPDVIEQPLAPALSHLFNHQTHHRGQAHVILTRLGHRDLALDLMFYQRESGVGL
ncbi:Uncharacterized damage-inducible protein DinB (forms a four-helix bundle) [Pseudoxanthobacter soli DSM 19599]|uniref:Uncharacterized damage-inducible protein DinB (Forms a four-helix bundle) n=1 Tax=Pseudoxanthobacter soli DSM 19599 TaxID=1123029 RepID=A0A1M7ZLL8_9HYPH|nr:DinB family protein [Pseudoxanthobacter soli]SHO65771.1 Uncharacterized damage-inducible protein DinB (forms a four-helix bundle) [Pseudoxanthobacter soli DSM 19599]